MKDTIELSKQEAEIVQQSRREIEEVRYWYFIRNNALNLFECVAVPF